MKIELIAIDLDGTALRSDHLTMSSGVEQAIREAWAKGVYVIPVTGRPYRLLPPCLLGHPVWESFSVLCNGAEIRDQRNGEVLNHFPLSPEVLEQVLQIALRYDLPVEFNSDGRLYLTHYSYEKELLEPALHFHCTEFIPRHGSLVESLAGCCSREVEKIHINCIPVDRWEQAERELQALPVSVVCEKPPNLEVTHREATKGKGLRRLCSRLGISLENVMAIGDSGNDLSMLETAGFSVAMGNAPDRVKTAAKYVAESNLEDGAARAIYKFVL